MRLWYSGGGFSSHGSCSFRANARIWGWLSAWKERLTWKPKLPPVRYGKSRFHDGQSLHREAIHVGHIGSGLFWRYVPRNAGAAPALAASMRVCPISGFPPHGHIFRIPTPRFPVFCGISAPFHRSATKNSGKMSGFRPIPRPSGQSPPAAIYRRNC
jgi:hypothetical protein